jgi:hypothetical protein
MKTLKSEFKELIISALEKHAEDWDLIGIESGEDSLIASAAVHGVRAGGMIPPCLRIVERNGLLGIEVRKITTVGSAGTTFNRAVRHLVSRLVFRDFNDDETKFMENIEMCEIHAGLFLNSPRTAEDLLIAVIQGSNDSVVFTRAIIDSRDGEAYVSAAIECDYEALPPSFVNVTEAVLSHAARLGRFVRIMRDLVIPDTPPSREEVCKVLTAKEEAAKQTSSRPAAVSEPEMVL